MVVRRTGLEPKRQAISKCYSKQHRDGFPKALHSNSLWDGKGLTIEWAQPFDTLAESIVAARNNKAPEGAQNGGFERWRPARVFL
jgi:hypothetical protein